MLKDYVRSIAIARPTFVMFVATILTGVINYVYQIYMGRSLGAGSYSELSALISILYIVAVPASAIQNVMVRYVSKYKAKGMYGAISWLMRKTLVIVLIFAAASVIILLLLTPSLEDYLSLTSVLPLFVLTIGIFLSFIGPVVTGPLQGLQRFLLLGTQGVAGALVKLLFGVVLVIAGFGVAGAIGGIVIGTLVALVLCFYPLRKYFLSQGTPTDSKEIWRFTFPVVVAVLCMTVLTNVDIILARHYFSANDAGLYAAASVLSKIILFIPGAIAAVMFPMVSDAHARAVEPISILRKSILLTFALCLIVAIGFLLAPNIVVGSLYGQEYLAADGTLQILGFAMVFFAIANLFMIYGLATDYRMLIWMLAIATILEILLIMMFHQSLEMVAVDLLVSGIATTALSAFYLRTRGKLVNTSPKRM